MIDSEKEICLKLFNRVFHKYISELEKYDFTIDYEKSDYRNYVQFLNLTKEQYVYLDFENKTFKSWQLEVNGQRPTSISFDVLTIFTNLLLDKIVFDAAKYLTSVLLSSESIANTTENIANNKTENDNSEVS